jgi:hypothetical protein
MKASIIGSVVLILIVVGGVGLGGRGHAMQCPPGTFPLAVDFDPANLDPATVQAFQAIANTLNGYTGYQNDRSTFFGGHTPDGGYNLTGWQALITSAQPNANGHLATLLVIPDLTSNGSDAIIRDLAYFEQYQVNADGTFAYVGSLDPNGQAGGVSTAIDLL